MDAQPAPPPVVKAPPAPPTRLTRLREWAETKPAQREPALLQGGEEQLAEAYELALKPGSWEVFRALDELEDRDIGRTAERVAIRATALILRNRAETAAGLLAEVVGEGSEDSELHYLYARALAANDWPDLALEQFERALEIRPEEPSYLTLYASLLLYLGRHEEAEAARKAARRSQLRDERMQDVHEMVRRGTLEALQEERKDLRRAEEFGVAGGAFVLLERGRKGPLFKGQALCVSDDGGTVGGRVEPQGALVAIETGAAWMGPTYCGAGHPDFGHSIASLSADGRRGVAVFRSGNFLDLVLADRSTCTTLLWSRDPKNVLELNLGPAISELNEKFGGPDMRALIVTGRSISSNGSVIAGDFLFEPDSGLTRTAGLYMGFWWAPDTNTIQVLGQPKNPTSGSSSFVRGMSGDGSRIVGASEGRMAWWDREERHAKLFGPAEGIKGSAHAATHDGSLVAGARLMENGRNRAVLLRGDEILDLVSFDGEGSGSAALDLTDDGSVVVGFGHLDRLQTACLWIGGEKEPVSVLSLLRKSDREALEERGIVLREVSAITPDGSTLVGTAASRTNTWAWRLQLHRAHE